MTTKVYINLPVQNVGNAIGFFTKLGFDLDAEYTTENAGCLVLRDGVYALLLDRQYFDSFTSRTVADAGQVTEVAIAVEFDTRERVDQVVDTALAAGAEKAGDIIEDEYMYGRGFHDLDGHLWNVLHMRATGE
jgi:predicted lactoylglutathione lyase